MSWGDLSWLAERGYERMYERGEYHLETWILRGRAADRVGGRKVWIMWTGDQEAAEFVEVSTALHDNIGGERR